MNIAGMVVIVLTIAQVLKEFLRKWAKIEGVASVILVICVSAGVVGYKFVTETMPFDLATFVSLVASVASMAIGGKLTASSIAKKIGK